ncbi:Variant-specific surface protein, partial [Giardia duodenalis]
VLKSEYYSISAAPGSGVCREARDGACVQYAEEVTDRTKKSMRVREGSTGCTADSTNTDHCASGKCDVTIGDKTYCSQCEANYVPIDGTCIEAAGQTDKCTTNDGKNACTQCGDGYFLHKGGCYQIGGTVGLLICDDKTATSGKDGICVSCHEGYFKNPTQAADKQSCIACSDTATVDNVKGVAGCATCEPPNPSGAATCLTCLDGYYNSGTDSVTCTACDNACATCSGDGANKCTSCKEADKYLKTDSSAGTSQCVIEAACKQGGTHCPTTTTDGKKICTLCNDAANGGIADCKTCSKSGETVTCSACNNGKKPNVAGTGCFDCQMDGCSHCSANGVCEECDGDKIVKTAAGATSCIEEADCTKAEGFFVKNGTPKTCEACGDENCATCAAEGTGKCSKCKATNTAGAKLYLKTASSSPTGTCVEASGCGSAAFPKDDAENGNKCVLCGDTTNGVTNCAECTAPAQGKTKPACTKCTSGFLHTPEGGETSCPTSCPDGYFGHTSADSGNLQTCQSCSAPKEDLNPAVTGIPGCTQCTYTAASTNTLKCTACGSGYKLEGEACVPASANRSGLSTGAIAGISVAAVVVVGGLVGFLCWWFVCRGKA